MRADQVSTIHSPEAFAASPAAGFDGIFDWKYLIEPVQRATGRKIQPMDIDCHFEVGGHHLVFETKKEGVEIPGAQRQALLQLWAKGYHTVVFLWGKREPFEWQVYYPCGKQVWTRADERAGPIKEARMAELQDFVFRWATWADATPCPFQFSGEMGK